MLSRSLLMFALLTGLASFARASDDVTIYGAGLSSCKKYVVAREEQSSDVVAYTDWLSGYLSGVNTTSTHRSNFLSHDELEDALVWLNDYCQMHPSARVAEAAWALVAGAKTGPAAHSVEVTAYGSGYKPCALYRQARTEQSIELNVDRVQFIAWLGGYLSGTNAISLQTSNALGGLPLSEAAQWLDEYCDNHAEISFGSAVQALIVSKHSDDSRAHLANTRIPAGAGSNPPATRSDQQAAP